MTARRADDTRWLTPDELDHWKAVVALVMTLPPALDAQLKRDAGMNAFEYHVLVALSEASGRRLPMSELALLSKGSPSRLSHAVGRLERAGLVERRDSAEGGRRTDAHLTAAGLRRLRRAAPGHVAQARRLVVDALSPAQLQALGEAARAVVAVTAPDVAEAITSG